ncbi:MAG: DNA polymerase Y family protein [Marinobacter sp.]|uniref:Y-family DNA polymerase n=1 Tax=Marinobacter sp. TaxID=50741 RepID=UPI001B5D9C3A|nr:DNA polymerase Y family protein [Marinobacter sp.]MBQ0746263.1 DNA polymerase Y family protein [Marinobacter sp.]MBQ0814625.1 DNA polymerase Y family protein [Marinobacter sp.]|tara:strand:- start:31877 stop:33295 length:1419 start_codon:yes stop_codon:yes gene_type:complete
MLWLYLHFPHLLLDHIRRSGENVAALVIVEGSGQRVIQACPAARDLGVGAGMRLKTAVSLVPELGIVRADQQQEARILEDQARWLYRYAAHIVLVPPNGLLAEIGSLQRLYGGLSAVWQTVEEVLHERQLTAWPGIGHTPLAARLIARNGKGECSSDKGCILQTLGQMPLLAAEFDERTCTRLQRLGLNTLGEVFSLPPAEMARRLSPETLAYIQKIQGSRPDPQAPWQPPHYFRQQADFVQDIEQSQGLLFPLQRILSELEKDLCWRQQDTDCLLLVLRHRHAEPTRLRIRTSGPEHRAEAFLNLISLRFEHQPLQAPVVSLRLTVKRFLGREASGGQDLLGESQDLNEAWHTLMSRLQARLGENALKQLAPQADHRPERAWSASEVQRTSRVMKTKASQLPQRPLWLLRGPQPLTEIPQAWFTGPERISGGWWDGQRVHRDYYIAQLNNGQLAWVFRDVREGWFVHGWFG